MEKGPSSSELDNAIKELTLKGSRPQMPPSPEELESALARLVHQRKEEKGETLVQNSTFPQNHPIKGLDLRLPPSMKEVVLLGNFYGVQESIEEEKKASRKLLGAISASEWLCDGSRSRTTNISAASLATMRANGIETNYTPLVLRFRRNEEQSLVRLDTVIWQKDELGKEVLAEVSIFDVEDAGKDKVNVVNCHKNGLSLHVNVNGVWHQIEFFDKKDCTGVHKALKVLIKS